MSEIETLISEDMLDRLIELAVAKPPSPPSQQHVKLLRTRPLLREGEYLVHVDYTIPPFDELEKEFGKGNVSAIFDGRPFQKHPSCADIDETPGERVMLVKGFNHAIGSNNAIKAMDKLGYRPATHLEAYAFLKASPELSRQFWIAALGSEAGVDGRRRVAFLWHDDDGRSLRMDRFAGDWFVHCRFLFVRK